MIYYMQGGENMATILTREGLAKELKVHPKTVDNMRKDGLPEIKVNRTVRFDLDDVLEWMKGRD